MSYNLSLEALLAENRRLKELGTQLEAQNQALETHKQALESRNQTLETQKQALENKTQTLQSQVQELEQVRRDLEHKIAIYKQHLFGSVPSKLIPNNWTLELPRPLGKRVSK